MATPLIFEPSESDIQNWMTIPGGNSTTWTDNDAYMLLYSNEINLKDYLATDLWSEDYNTSIHARGYQEYTDGYAARVVIKFPYAKLDESLDGFGMIFSEFGY